MGMMVPPATSSLRISRSPSALRETRSWTAQPIPAPKPPPGSPTSLRSPTGTEMPPLSSKERFDCATASVVAPANVSIANAEVQAAIAGARPLSKLDMALAPFMARNHPAEEMSRSSPHDRFRE